MTKTLIKELDVLKLRRVDFCPDHFTTTNTPRHYNLENAIVAWIETNLSGRFFFGLNIELKNNTIEKVYTIGFEKASELSFFMLACPHLKYN